MKLIVIIPCNNEEETIGDVIKSIPRQIEVVDDVLVYLIDDGSSDGSVRVAREAGADKIVSHKKRQGLAKTFQDGLNIALRDGADLIVNTDADNQYNQEQISDLIKPILENKADMVIGDRQIEKLDFMPGGNKYGNMLGSWVLRCLTKTKVRDVSSGFRAFSRELALRINIHSSHTYTHETIIQAVFNKQVIVDVPIDFQARTAGKSKLIRGLFSHIKNSLLVIIRTILMYRPLKTLFYLGSLIMLPGIFLGLRFLYFYFNASGTGKIQSLILASILISIGFFVFILGLIGDLISKNRKLNEEIVYLLKKNE